MTTDNSTPETSPEAPAPGPETGPETSPTPGPETSPPQDPVKTELAALQVEMRQAMARGDSRDARRLSERAERLRSGEIRPTPEPTPIPAAEVYDPTVRPPSEAELEQRDAAIAEAERSGLVVRGEDGRVDEAETWSALTDGVVAADFKEMRVPFQQVDRELSKSGDREAFRAHSERQLLQSHYKDDAGAMKRAISEVQAAADSLDHGDMFVDWLNATGYLSHPSTHQLVVSKARELLSRKKGK